MSVRSLNRSVGPAIMLLALEISGSIIGVWANMEDITIAQDFLLVRLGFFW